DYIFLEGFWENLYPKILFFKNSDEVEQLISQILEHSSGNEILLTTFCLSGLFFVSENFRSSDLMKKFSLLNELGRIDQNLKTHLEALPILNIKKNPKKLLEIYNSTSLVKKNL
ncbi:MAG: hypothetical protein ACTSRD_14960, partial [Promethearchaeota archaeon]